MTVDEWLRELGGVAHRRALLRLVSRSELDAAVRSGEVVRDSRARYALPESELGIRAAAQLGGVLSLTSAALRHGWAVKTVPDKPHVTVSRGRKVGQRDRVAHVHFAELTAPEIDGVCTSVEVTLDNCLRQLPFDEALCVADSARRAGVGDQLLQALADSAVGPGSRQLRRVVHESSALSANPFESTLRAIALDVPGLNVAPQVEITEDGTLMRPDLVDDELRLVLEADSFEWHGSRAALASDARRYNLLIVHGWVVLRFSYEEVMFHADDVRRTLLAAVALTQLLNERTPQRHSAA